MVKYSHIVEENKMTQRFKPIATVSIIVKYKDKYLIVEEKLDNGTPVFNTPSGHLEHRENILEGAIRELDEETGIKVNTLDGIVGVYNLVQNYYSIIRTCFYLECKEEPVVCPHDPDNDIVATHWLTLDECKNIQKKMRSSMIFGSIMDFENGERYPLSILKNYNSIY